jgi:hypothetical protein
MNMTEIPDLRLLVYYTLLKCHLSENMSFRISYYLIQFLGIT